MELWTMRTPGVGTVERPAERAAAAGRDGFGAGRGEARTAERLLTTEILPALRERGADRPTDPAQGAP